MECTAVTIPKLHKPCTCGSKIKAKKCCFTPAKLAIIEKARRKAEEERKHKADAQRIYESAVHLYEGDEAKQDHDKAFKLMTQAASMGNEDARCDSALMLERGDGCEQDAPRAVEIYCEGIECGHVQSMNNLAGLLEEGTKGVAEDAPRAVALFEKAILAGDDTLSMHNLACLLQNGKKGVPENAPRAVELYKMAIAKGDTQSSYSLALLFHHGAEDLPINIDESVKYYQKAMDGGHTLAMHNFAGMLEHGIGMDADSAASLALYRKASRLGNAASTAQVASLELWKLRSESTDKMAIARATRETALALKESIVAGKCEGHKEVLEDLTESITCDYCYQTCEEAGIEKFKKCGECLVARYCNKECSKLAWEDHKVECAASKLARMNGTAGSFLADCGVAEKDDFSVGNDPHIVLPAVRPRSPPQRESVCDHCGKTKAEAGIGKFKKCGGCLTARYCSNDCGSAAWMAHSKVCAAAKKAAASQKARDEAGPGDRMQRNRDCKISGPFDEELKRLEKEAASGSKSGGASGSKSNGASGSAALD